MSAVLAKMKTNGVEAIAKLILEQPNADYDGVDMNVDFDNVNKVVNKQRKVYAKEMKKKK